MEGAALYVSEVLAAVSAEIAFHFMSVVPLQLIEVNAVPTNVLKN